jgi:hypothetical protein
MFRTKHFISIALSTVVLLTGCSLPGGGRSTPALTGPCANPLYPVLAGANWTYQLTGTTNDTITRRINTINADGFEDQDTFDSGPVRTGKWKCADGALTALDPVGEMTAAVQRGAETVSFGTTDSSGVTLPANVAAGDTWTQSFSLAGTLTINGKSDDATNDTTLNCTANGMENVTVPAASFDAMKVTCENSIQITVTANDITIPAPVITFTSETWYGPNVGLVKSVASGGGIDTTTILLAYSLP